MSTVKSVCKLALIKDTVDGLCKRTLPNKKKIQQIVEQITDTVIASEALLQPGPLRVKVNKALHHIDLEAPLTTHEG